MTADIATLEKLYHCFNARDIDGVLAALADDVVWANGMDGGHVRGHAGIRDYWTRQWSLVAPHVAPVSFREAAGDSIVVRVVQSVRDLAGQPLQEQTHGLTNKTVGHIFRFRNGKVTHFDIEDEASDTRPSPGS